MKAIFITQHGDSTVLRLRETETPIPSGQEVMVRVTAIGINYADILVREGVYPIGPLPAIAGAEVTGIIESVGNDVHDLKPGQKVSGVAQQGYAAYALLQASQVFPVPDEIPSEQALSFQALTACHLLEQTNGYQSLLITAAAGGIGSMVVQLAKSRGIPLIIDMTGNNKKMEYIRSMRATHAISFQDDQWASVLQEITARKGVDLVLDAVGGPIGASLIHQLAPGGKMVVFGSNGQDSAYTLRSLKRNPCGEKPVVIDRLIFYHYLSALQYQPPVNSNTCIH